MTQTRVGLLGATSLVGKCLTRLLISRGVRVCAYSRQSIMLGDDGVIWHNLSKACAKNADKLDHWICVAPIWALVEHFPRIEASGALRVVALSSTSCFTKIDSGDTKESAIAARLINGEKQFLAWGKTHGIECVILRPTLIYGLGQDKNISEIARFIRRFGFFPIFGAAQGLRQPIHAEDVAAACFAALQATGVVGRAYNISGGETLTYREMVTRVFVASGHRPRLLTIPLWVFHLTAAMLRYLPRYQQWSVAMVERMNQDLVFDHTDATRELDFNPRGFVLDAESLPR